MGKERVFHYPELGEMYLGRLLSVASGNGCAWAVVQLEKDRQDTVAVIRRSGDGTSSIILDTDGNGHQPFIVTRPDGGAAVVWNEAHGGAWRLRGALIGDGATCADDAETIAESGELFLPPSAAFVGRDLWVAWSALEGGRLRVRLACKHNGVWQVHGPISPEGVDAFRPSVAATADRVFVVWDQYRDGTYEIAYTSSAASGWDVVQSMGQAGERWFCPRAVATDHGAAYATWVVMQEVTDGLGIVDHFPFAMVAGLGDDGPAFLLDKNSPADPRIVADMREGLLASKTYKGYHGLRRNPYLSVSDDGTLWCLWEMRKEGDTHLHGYLTGRMLEPDRSWTAPRLFYYGHYSYAVPPRFSGKGMPIAHIVFDETDLGRVAIDEVDLTAGEPYEIDPSRWSRWTPTVIQPSTPPRPSLDVGGRALHVFWADTHCHSNFSADAECEPDEAIHFARDVAGIDAVCVVDNDYYPHKALTEAEWQVHNEYARHFTTEGEFLVFPGWEFTFHRADLKPDFNHRYVAYPRPGGKLFRRIDPESCMDKKLVACLRGTPALCFPHHGTWELVDTSQEWNVEVCSSWRVCIEEMDFAVRALKAGHRFGFVGSSDTHRSSPGLGGALTGVYAEALTPEAVFDAYRNRRTIATQGIFVHADLRVAGAFIGGETSCQGAPTIEASVDAPDTIEFVEVVRDGTAIRHEAPGGATCRLRFEDGDAPPGTHFYFLRIKLVGDPSFNTSPDQHCTGAFTLDSRYPHNLARARGVFAWTSPIWVTVAQ